MVAAPSDRTTLRVDLRTGAEVEADRFEQYERGAGRVDIGRGQDPGVLLDDRRGGVGDLRGLVLLDRGPRVVAVPDEERRRVHRGESGRHARDQVVDVLLVEVHVVAGAEAAHVAADVVLPRVG